jgi:hypothetical protein
MTPNFAPATSNVDLSSDHSPVIVDLTTHTVPPVHPHRLSNRSTNRDFFGLLITERLTLNIHLTSIEDIEEGIKLFNETIQWAGWTATPKSTAPIHTHDYPTFIKLKLEEKRRLRKRRHRSRTPEKNDYSTELHGNLNIYSGTEITASQHFYKALHRLRQLTIPYGKRLRN